MKAIFRIIKKCVLAVTGVLGGVVAGLILFVSLLHLKSFYGVAMPSLWVLGPAMVFFTAVLALLAPRFFMYYFLCPLSWVLSEGDIDLHEGTNGAWNSFVANLVYCLGLLALFSGAFFSMPMVFGVGAMLILIFSAMLMTETLRSQTRGNQAAATDIDKPTPS